jgi:hypothetical protein
MAMKKKRKRFYLEEKFKILWDVEKYMGTHVSLSKQLGISVSTLSTIVKNHNMFEENANQCRPMKKKRKYVKKSRFEELKDF